MRSGPASSRDDRQEVRRLLGRSPSRVLVLGAGGSAAAGRWQEAGASVTSLAEPGALEAQEGRWDVVYLSGSLERERWDRWLLQRVHRVLVPAGLLVVVAPNLLDLGSLQGLRYLASRVALQLGRRLRPRSVIPAADRSAFRGRRYPPARLARMVESVAFEVIACSTADRGLPDVVVKALGGVGRRIGRHVLLVARRLPSLWGPGRPFPAQERALQRYRDLHPKAIEARDAWRRAVGIDGPQPVDLEDWARRGAVVFSPHPDDEIIGCGGTLLDLSSRGGSVTIVQVTDGSDSAAFVNEPESVRTSIRLEEARAVAEGLRARELVSLRADNRSLRATPELRARFREVIDRTGPGLVFAPSFTDIHPDHQTVLRLVFEALGDLSGPLPDVALYEVWSLVAPTHVNDVGSRIGEIEALLLMYETALKIDDYVHLVAERLVFNAYEHLGRAGYAEGFQVLPGVRFLELAEKHFQGAGATR